MHTKSAHSPTAGTAHMQPYAHAHACSCTHAPRQSATIGDEQGTGTQQLLLDLDKRFKLQQLLVDNLCDFMAAAQRWLAEPVEAGGGGGATHRLNGGSEVGLECKGAQAVRRARWGRMKASRGKRAEGPRVAERGVGAYSELRQGGRPGGTKGAAFHELGAAGRGEQKGSRAK